MLRMVAVAVCLALSAVPASAAKGGNGRPAEVEADGGHDLGRAIITAAEQALIRDYFRTNPPAAAHRLPPGMQKRLAQGKPLPPGIARKLPEGLSPRLPRRQGYDFRMVGADVLLVEVATGVIVDILRDVMR